MLERFESGDRSSRAVDGIPPYSRRLPRFQLDRNRPYGSNDATRRTFPSGTSVTRRMLSSRFLARNPLHAHNGDPDAKGCYRQLSAFEGASLSPSSARSASANGCSEWIVGHSSRARIIGHIERPRRRVRRIRVEKERFITRWGHSIQLQE